MSPSARSAFLLPSSRTVCPPSFLKQPLFGWHPSLSFLSGAHSPPGLSYSLKLRDAFKNQGGGFPKFASPSLRTHGPQLRPLPFLCPPAPRRTPRAQRDLWPRQVWVSQEPPPRTTYTSGVSQAASTVQSRSIRTRRPPGTRAPFSWRSLGSPPALLYPAPIEADAGPGLAVTTGLGPAFHIPLLVLGVKPHWLVSPAPSWSFHAAVSSRPCFRLWLQPPVLRTAINVAINNEPGRKDNRGRCGIREAGRFGSLVSLCFAYLNFP